jgi:hypothetical protein
MEVLLNNILLYINNRIGQQVIPHVVKKEGLAFHQVSHKSEPVVALVAMSLSPRFVLKLETRSC